MGRDLGRFWAKVEKRPNGCWLWTAGKDGHGYGQFHPGGPRGTKMALAHRYSWTIANAGIPEGMCVLHRCDTPACVRPDHLFLGTKGDNSRDMVTKGRHATSTQPERQARGERIGIAKLTAGSVRRIRCEYDRGATQTELAKRYGTHQTNVSLIVRRKVWAHV